MSKLDDSHYALRFTRRRPKSNWSAINIRRFNELQAAGLVMPAGLAAFESRDRAVSEERPAALDGAHEQRMRARPAAWRFFSEQPPGYRRQAAWYVMSARGEATRDRRLAQLIEASAQGRRLMAITGVATSAARAADPALADRRADSRAATAPLGRTAAAAASRAPRAKITARLTAAGGHRGKRAGKPASR